MKTVKELMDLKGRVVVITGGAGHIGAEMAEALAELGATIVVLDIVQDQSEAVAKRLSRRYGAEALSHVVDLRDAQGIRSVPEFVRKHFGRLDVLINCAAMVGSLELKGWVAPFQEQSLDVWREALEVNLTAPFLLTQACAELLAVSGCGSVVNVSSIYGMVGPDWRLYEGTPMGNPAAYSASKGGLLQLTRWLATTLAPAIRVNAITAGGVYRSTQEPFLSRYLTRVPAGRMATEEDFKGAVAYLASDLSLYMTGQNLVVDGGWTAW